MVLMGLGMGPTIPLYTLAIQNAVQPRQIGVATSSATFFRQLGMTMGVALMGTVFAGTLVGELRTRTAQSLEGVPTPLREQLFVIDRTFDESGRVSKFTFTGRGWGHGVGLCQVGSFGMAQAGSTYDRILRHYYTGITLDTAY